MPLGYREDAGEFRLDDHQPLVADAGVNDFLPALLLVPLLSLVANFVNETLARTQPAFGSVAIPLFVGKADNALDATPCCSFACLCRVPDKNGEQIRVMPIALNLVIRAIANDVAHGGEKLNQNCDEIGFGMGLDLPHHITGQAMIGIAAHCGPRDHSGRH